MNHVPATRFVASAFCSGIVYVWLEAAYRLLGTYTSLSAFYRVWGPRDGFITAMWLSMGAIALAVFLILNYIALRNRRNVGSLRLWVFAFAVSVIVAPLIGEIGTPIGI